MTIPTIAATLLFLSCILISHLTSSTVSSYISEDDWVKLSMKQQRRIFIFGNSKKFTCEAVGSPSPTITWRKNNDTIKESENMTDEADGPINNDGAVGDIVSHLYMPCLKVLDRYSLISCVANAAVSRIMEYSQINLSNIVDDHFTGCLENEAGDPPSFTVRTKSIAQDLGKDVKLFCRVKGIPKPVSYWIAPNGKMIVNSTKYRVLEKGSLVITQLTQDDMGEYKCIAENMAGEAVTSSFVNPKIQEKNDTISENQN